MWGVILWQPIEKHIAGMINCMPFQAKAGQEQALFKPLQNI
jgi:hypothetical protein